MDYTQITGKKSREMMACADMDVNMILEPARFYDVDRIFLLCDNSENNRLHEVRQRIMEEIFQQSKDLPKRVFPVDIHDCYAMMKVLRSILPEDDDGRELYINMSSGTPEFAVAVMSMCRRTEKVTAFTVRTESYTFHTDDVRGILFKHGHPIWISKEVSDPTKVMMLELDGTRKDLIECLRIMRDLNTGERNLSFADIIEKLKDAHRWNYEPDRRRGKTDDAQKERMYFKRNFLTPLEDLGWIKEDRVVKNRFRITPEGQIVLDVYYGD